VSFVGEEEEYIYIVFSVREEEEAVQEVIPSREGERGTLFFWVENLLPSAALLWVPLCVCVCVCV
jgi:hypothetical protein